MIVECVPNFSEGRDPAIVGGIARAVTGVRHVALFDAVSDPDHNRSVLTFAGPPKATAEAAFEAVRKAVTSIDIGSHQGVHPRLGVADVVPFVPLDRVSLRGCAGIARVVGARIWQELKLPVYLYECAALRPECQRLESVRKLAPAGLPPDFGEGRHPTAGACVVGARKLLIAWNIHLETGDLAVARQIARHIRESNGGLRAVKALGLPLESRRQVQVSINLVDFELTPLHVIFNAVARECLRHGIAIAGSELIGLIPAAALEASRGYDLQWLNLRPELIIENRLQSLGLD